MVVAQAHGQLAERLKARAVLEEKREYKAAQLLQAWWLTLTGAYAARIKARAKLELRREEIRMNAAALKIQSRWRIKQGKDGTAPSAPRETRAAAKR